jgi:hypothetical protein
MINQFIKSFSKKTMSNYSKRHKEAFCLTLKHPIFRKLISELCYLHNLIIRYSQSVRVVDDLGSSRICLSTQATASRHVFLFAEH